MDKTTRGLFALLRDMGATVSRGDPNTWSLMLANPRPTALGPDGPVHAVVGFSIGSKNPIHALDVLIAFGKEHVPGEWFVDLTRAEAAIVWGAIALDQQALIRRHRPMDAPPGWMFSRAGVDVCEGRLLETRSVIGGVPLYIANGSVVTTDPAKAHPSFPKSVGEAVWSDQHGELYVPHKGAADPWHHFPWNGSPMDLAGAIASKLSVGDVGRLIDSLGKVAKLPKAKPPKPMAESLRKIAEDTLGLVGIAVPEATDALYDALEDAFRGDGLGNVLESVASLREEMGRAKALSDCLGVVTNIHPFTTGVGMRQAIYAEIAELADLPLTVPDRPIVPSMAEKVDAVLHGEDQEVVIRVRPEGLSFHRRGALNEGVYEVRLRSEDGKHGATLALPSDDMLRGVGPDRDLEIVLRVPAPKKGKRHPLAVIPAQEVEDASCVVAFVGGHTYVLKSTKAKVGGGRETQVEALHVLAKRFPDLPWLWTPAELKRTAAIKRTLDNHDIRWLEPLLSRHGCYVRSWEGGTLEEEYRDSTGLGGRLGEVVIRLSSLPM